MIVDNLKLLAELKARVDLVKRNPRPVVVVGYDAAAALYVHEMTPKNKGKRRRSGIGSYWGPSMYGNQYLLGPVRQFSAEVSRIITNVYAKTGDLLGALEVGGLRFQRESLARVPKEYGPLYQSAFTEKE